MNILIVDDEAMMLDSLRIGLESNGYRVFQSSGVQQALDQLNYGGHGIDLIATDYLMPTMNGIDLLEAVRKSHPTLPVMLMTAYADRSMVIKALNNRCDSFIEKPFSLDQLISEIERIKLYQLQNTKSSDLKQLLPKIVHQINNPLMSISGFAELIRTNVGNGDRLLKYADNILAAVYQIGCINKQIMNAGRMEVVKCVPVELGALLEGCLGMFHGMFTLKGVQVERKIPEQGLQVLGDPFSLEQVFNNLVINAVDAMDGRSEKTLAITVTPPQGSDFVEVTLKDTGCGIPEHLLEKIFEPYFTDKRQGNGLGLGVIKNAVDNHGGKVVVESRVGVGSKFTVRLPSIQVENIDRMLAAKGDNADIIDGSVAGANDYLIKPSDVCDLLARGEVWRRMTEMQANLLDALQINNEALKAAGKIQLSLLPKHFSAGAQENFAWKFKPYDDVGGDIFNIVSLDASHIGLYMLDVAGHGIPSAMISVMVYQLLNPHSGILVDHSVDPPQILEPEAVLNILDSEFPLMRFNRHFTIVYAVLDLVSNTLTYSNAAHCAPIVISRENEIKILTVSGTVIGVNAIPFGQESVTLAPGDKVVFLSDGVIDTRNANNEFFGEERLYQTLQELQSFAIDDLVQGLYAKVMSFAKAQRADDDISILALEIKDVIDAASNKMPELDEYDSMFGLFHPSTTRKW